jgi:uncharacterized protein with HEPN domain
MSKRSAKLLIEDMWKAVLKIDRYRNGMDRELFMGDEKTIDAIVRNLEIIGLRHQIVHEYFGVDLDILWRILVQDLPFFREALGRIRASLGA